MQKFIMKPRIDMYEGVRVTKDTKLEFNTENVQQTVENLILHSVTTIKGEGYESTNHSTIYLNEGDILIFEAEGRGYIKPVEPFGSVDEAIQDLECIRSLGEENVQD